jgi:hypothetical protein
LTRAALERTVGAPFYPGIEMTYIVRDPSIYAAPFRFADHLAPGDITRWMAMPWQADFFECNTFWWPAARPDDVVPASTYLASVLAQQGAPGYLLTPATLQRLGADVPADVLAELEPLVGVPFGTDADAAWAIGHLIGGEAFDRFGHVVIDAARRHDFVRNLGSLGQRRQWARGLGGPDDEPHGDNEMVQHWHELGFVVPIVAPNGQIVHVETERSVALPETPPRPGAT